MLDVLQLDPQVLHVEGNQEAVSGSKPQFWKRLPKMPAILAMLRGQSAKNALSLILAQFHSKRVFHFSPTVALVSAHLPLYMLSKVEGRLPCAVA